MTSIISKSSALINSILHTPTALSSIAAINLKYCVNAPKQASVRKFIQHRLPILAYHNPDLSVTVELERDRTIKSYRSSITLLTSNNINNSNIINTNSTNSSNTVETILYGDELQTDSELWNEILKIDKQYAKKSNRN